MSVAGNLASKEYILDTMYSNTKYAYDIHPSLLFLTLE